MTNTHYEAAVKCLHADTDGAGSYLDPDTRNFERAKVEATLALAVEQQRTADAAENANLINYLNVATQYRLAYAPSEAVLKSVQADVEQRLGLA